MPLFSLDANLTAIALVFLANHAVASGTTAGYQLFVKLRLCCNFSSKQATGIRHKNDCVMLRVSFRITDKQAELFVLHLVGFRQNIAEIMWLAYQLVFIAILFRFLQG